MINSLKPPQSRLCWIDSYAYLDDGEGGLYWQNQDLLQEVSMVLVNIKYFETGSSSLAQGKVLAKRV
jgi:hypothetical protein